LDEIKAKKVTVSALATELPPYIGWVGFEPTTSRSSSEVTLS
jgi:hypothetical protein